MNTTTSAIEFAKPTASQGLEDLLKNPATRAGGGNGSKFQDLTIVGSLRNRILRFPEGTTWLRFLPAIKGSTENWLMRIDRLELPNAKMAYPRGPLLEKVKTWLKENASDKIYTKDDKSGLKLWPKPFMLGYCVIEAFPKGERLKIFGASGYDGGRGANPGLGHRIASAASATDNEPGSPAFGARIHLDLADATEGRMVSVTRHGADQTTSYDAKIGSKAAPLSMERLQELLTNDELEMVMPLEKIVQSTDDATLEEHLTRELGTEVMARIAKA